MNQDLKIESQESTKTSALNSLRHQRLTVQPSWNLKNPWGFSKGISLFKLADFQENPPSREMNHPMTFLNAEPQERSIDFSQAIRESRPHRGQKVGHVEKAMRESWM